MAEHDDEAKRLRAVALQNSNAIHAARQKAERELARERERVRVTLASIGDAVLSTDADARVTFLNGVAEALTGWTQAEAAGRHLDDVFRIVNESTREPVPCPVRKVFATGIIVGLANHTVLIARDGTERPIDDSAAPIRDDSGELLGVVLVFRDITERRRAEQDVEERTRLAALGADIGRALTRADTLQGMLGNCAKSLVSHLDGAFARIWTANEAGDILELQASAGMYTHLDGPHRRVPVGRYKIGLIAQERQPHLTNAVVGDPRVPDQEWARREGLVAFAGYPLVVAERLVGVMAMFARHPLTETTLQAMASVANEIALGIGRKRAEEQLRASEVRFRELADTAPAMLWVTDPSGSCTFLSREWYEFTGQAEAEALGLGWTEATHPDDRAEAGRVFLAANGRREMFRCEYRLGGPGGVHRWVIDIGRPRFSPAGEYLGMAGVVIDVHDQRAAELAVREKDQRLTLLVENTKDYAVVISDLGGTVTEWQGGAERITGFSASEAIGQKGNLIFTPEDLAVGRPEAEMRKASRDGRAEDKRWHLRKDGSRFFADGVTTALYDGGGRLRGYGKVFKDATGEELAKESSRQHTERLKTLADISSSLNAVLDLPSVLGVVTAEGRLLIGAHHAVTEIAPGSADAVQSFSFSDELHAGIAALVPPSRSAIYQAVAADNKPVRLTHDELQAHIGWEDIREMAEGHPPIRGLLAVPIVGPSGGTLGVIQLSDKYAGEFTEEDEAILVQLAQMAAVAIENTRLYHALREGDRKKDDFLALLAHELRNPLAPIRNGLQVIRLSQDRTARERSQEMMERQLGHMVRLIDDLLDVSRINRNKMELRRAKVLLADAVGSAVETARPAIEAAGHELAIALPTEPVFLDADLTRLAQVFSNLLTNSAKYTEAGGRIRLSARVDGREVAVTVTDTGIGIPADALPHIFDMFSQVDRSIERSTGGLGIGLALVKGLVEMHGGTVSAASGGQIHGSEFTVRLPVLSVRTDTPPVAADHPVTDTGPKRRILVVDDNRDSAESMAEMLRLFGNEVALAYNGLEAVERAGAFRPDVILMDVGMPQLNGYEATRRIRELPWGKAATIIALTGWGQEGDRARSKEAGCNGHLVKPVSLADLQKLLGELA